MVNRPKTYEEAIAEIEELRVRLEEAAEVISAIRSGEVDAVVVKGPEGPQVYTLTGAEHTYRILVEAMNEGALVLSPEGLVVYCNRTFAAMLGILIDEVIGHSIYEFVADADVKSLTQLLEQAPRSAGKKEINLKHTDSGSAPAFISVGNLQTEEGPSIAAVVTDLTEHKRIDAELAQYREHLEELIKVRTSELAAVNEELGESEKQFRALAESVPEIIVWATTPDGKNTYFSQQWMDYTGLTLEESYGDGWIIPVHPDDRQRAWEAWQNAVNNDAGYSLEFRLRGADGDYRWWLIRGTPLRDESGKIIKWFGTCVDIQDMKQIEEALREQTALLDLAHDAIIVLSTGNKITFWSNGAEETYGWTREEAINCVAPELLETRFPKPLAEINADLAKTGKWEGELTHTRKDGREIVVASRWAVQLDESGRQTGVLEINRDITERKKAEEVLRESEERFRTMADAISQLAWMANPDGYIFWYNQRWYEYTGTTPEQMEGWGWQSVHDPEMLPSVLERWKTSIATGERFDMEFPLMGADGKFRAFLTRSVPIKDSKGHVWRWFGTNTDVSEAREAEQQLAQAREEELNRERNFSLLLQRALLPDKPSINHGYSLAVEYIPFFMGQEIGGDFYDVFEVEGGKAGVVIGDVSGKGLESAALAASTRSTIHTLAYETGCAGQALARANSILCSGKSAGLETKFVTVFIAVIDLETGEFCYASAGHPPAAICRNSGEVEFLQPDFAPPICVLPGAQYPDRRDRLEPGEVLVLFTDGIAEARRHWDLFDFEGIARSVREHRHRPVDEIAGELVAAANNWAQGHLSDDAAVVVIKREEPS